MKTNITSWLTMAGVVVVGLGNAWAMDTTSGNDGRIEWQLTMDLKLADPARDFAYSLDGKYAFVLTEKHQVLIYNQGGELLGRVPVEEGVSAIDIAPLGQMLFLLDSKKNYLSALAMDFVVDIDTTGAPIKGDIKAPLTIAVFSDFQCPYCKKVAPVLDQILQRNPATVRVAFMNMPLQNHEMAEPAAMAALAANEQNKFWEFHDLLFAEEKIKADSFRKIAAKLGLDIGRFEKDQQSKELRDKIGKDINQARILGVSGTPTVYVDGKRVNQLNVEDIQRTIDARLATRGKDADKKQP